MGRKRGNESGVPRALIDDLEEIVGSGHVLTDQTDLLAYHNDCSPAGIIRARGRRLAENQPAAIVQPAHEGDIQQLVEWARREETALVPFGAGSGVCLGAVGDRESVIVDLKRLDEIHEVDAENLLVRAGSGVMGVVLEKELRRQGYTMGHFPSSLYCSSLGGYLAARSAGQFSSRYGKIEDMVDSMTVVAGTGEEIRTAADGLDERPRRQTARFGPNLNQIFVGNEGTLGMITGATLKIEPAPDHQYYRGFEFESLEEGLRSVRRIMQAGLRPSCVRLYDPFDTLLKSGGSEGASAGRLPEQIRGWAREALSEEMLDEITDAVSDVRNSLVAGLVGQPGLVNSLVDRFASKSLLVVGFEGTSTLVEEEADWAFDLLARYGVDLGIEPGMNWLRHRFDASYQQSPLFDTGAFVDTMEVSTTWQNLENLYRRVRRAMQPHVLVLAHFSHVYPEGSSIYFTFLGHEPDTRRSLKLHEKTWKAGLDAVVEAGGSITHHHGVGALKTDWTEGDHTGGARQFEALKQTFDPDGILNPGKVYPRRN